MTEEEVKKLVTIAYKDGFKEGMRLMADTLVEGLPDLVRNVSEAITQSTKDRDNG